MRRRVAFETPPYDVKLLALKFGLTPGQVRGLLLKCGPDRNRLAAEAIKLRHR
jgi:hypothetical protein